MRSKDVNMLSGSIVKGLLAISLPVMVMNVLQSLFNIIDMTVLKTYDTGGSIAVGAVGVCSTLISLITGLVIGVSSGANVAIARRIGMKDRQGVDRAAEPTKENCKSGVNTSCLRNQNTPEIIRFRGFTMPFY